MPDDKTTTPLRDIVLQAAALTRTFGDLTAVDGVTLTIYRGEIFGLIGPNGAGKSTLIKMLTTLLPPTSGSAPMPRSMTSLSGSSLRQTRPKPREAMAKSGENVGQPVSMADRSIGQVLGDYATQTMAVAASCLSSPM